MSIYIYSGEDVYRQETALHKLLEKCHVSKDEIVSIDAGNQRAFRMDQAMMECDTFSLFNDTNKVVILRNPFFLNASVKEAEGKKNADAKKEERLRILESYLTNPNEHTTLVFYCHGYKADSRKKEYKLLTKYGAEVVEFLKMDEKEFQSYAKKELQKKGMHVDYDGMSEFFARVGTDTLLLQNAITKMELYDAKDFTREDITHLVPLNPEVNVFRLTSAFTKGNLKEVVQATDEMLQANYDYPVLIAMIAKRLRTIYNVKLLHERGLSDESIAVRMRVKKGSIYFVLKETQYLKSRTVLSYLNDLAILDQAIKHGETTPKDGYEQFILKNGNRKHAGD